ncbi:MAG: molecular chaperone TorD family protein [Thermodesulfobacteriota bacterium]
MEALFTDQLKNQAEITTANRSRMYSLIAEIFRYPDEPFRRQAQNGDLEQALGRLTENLPYPFEWREKEKARLRGLATVSDENIEVEFIRLFEAGPGSPPIPLLEGLYREDRQAIFRELILFYNHFGLSYGEGSMEDRPDHICYQMEFLHFLTFKELMALQSDRDVFPYMRAEQDFLERHPLLWTGQLLESCRRLEKNLPDSEDACLEVFHFYEALFQLTHEFLAADCRYLKTLLAP